MHRVCLICGLLLTAASWNWAEEAKVPLKTEIPEEVLAGTPPDVLALLYPGLQSPPEDGHPEFLVPAGTKNLALKKKVTSSDSNPVLGSLELVTDGSKEGTEEGFVELAPSLQWIQIDLEQSANVYAIYVWHFFREARSYHDVILQVSDDPEFKQGVTTVYSNDQDNSAGFGIGKSRPYIDCHIGWIFDAKGVQGRYVRLYSDGNTANGMNHYVEVEVYGKPAS